MIDPIPAATPVDGYVMHLFYKVELGQWVMLSAKEQLKAKTNLAALVQEIRATAGTQLITLAMVSPKADLGFVLLSPDLQSANAFEKRLSLALGPDVLTPIFSNFSITEATPHATDNEHPMQLFSELPDWPVVSFYPIAMRRNLGQNWYALSAEERRQLAAAQGAIGRKWEGQVYQFVTDCLGLDDPEWGVTLFAHTARQINEMVAELRHDPLGAQYTEFGEVYLGCQLPLDELFRRLLL